MQTEQKPIRVMLADDHPIVMTGFAMSLAGEGMDVVGQAKTPDEAAAMFAELQPDAGWTPKRVEHAVTAIRTRMSKGGVPGLTREEVGEPVGNALNDNLIRELVLSTTLVPPDLELLGD